MNWFRKHLNLTFLFAWLVSNVLVYIGYVVIPDAGDITWVSMFVLAGIISLGTEVWYLLQKRRSLFYLFLNLLNWIGFIILLSLENKGVQIEENKPGRIAPEQAIIPCKGCQTVMSYEKEFRRFVCPKCNKIKLVEDVDLTKPVSTATA